jgi:hypothetical protein
MRRFSRSLAVSRVNLLNGDVTKWFPDGRAPMSLRFFVLFCWLSLSSPSVAQQEPIDVPFDDAALTASPITATGKVSVRETVAANEVKSSWEWNVDATNISTKSVLLLIGELDAIGPHSNGGTQLTMEYFFGEPISPGETFSLYKRSSVHDSCCINPLRETHEPKATFRLIFVQFLDGSTFGDAAQAENALAIRDRTLQALRTLAQVAAKDKRRFQSQLERQLRLDDALGVFAAIRETQEQKGADAAIARTYKILDAAEDCRDMTLHEGYIPWLREYTVY